MNKTQIFILVCFIIAIFTTSLFISCTGEPPPPPPTSENYGISWNNIGPNVSKATSANYQANQCTGLTVSPGDINGTMYKISTIHTLSEE